jgi:hypothetical protein
LEFRQKYGLLERVPCVDEVVLRGKRNKDEQKKPGNEERRTNIEVAGVPGGVVLYEELA